MVLREFACPECGRVEEAFVRPGSTIPDCDYCARAMRPRITAPVIRGETVARS